MPSQRVIVFLGLAGAHAVLVLLGGALPDGIAPAVAGTVYLPLWLLQTTGLPVLGAGASGGWAAPNMGGWMLVAVLWAAVWWGCATALAGMFGSQRVRNRPYSDAFRRWFFVGLFILGVYMCVRAVS